MVKAKKKVSKPKQKVIKGKGDYTDDDRALLKEINRKIPDVSLGGIGRKIGNRFGLGELGETAGKGLSKLFGMGDYTVSSNSLMKMGNMSANDVPMFTKDGKRGIRVTEREYLGDIYSGGVLVNGSTTFDLNNFTVNPNDVKTFPWLSTISQCFDQWEPKGLVFEFVSTSSEYNGTSQALGTVIMATEYDTNDAPYTSKVEMENASYANSTKPSHTAIHGLECDPKERATELLYTGTPPTGQDKFYQLGRFSIATQGCSATGQALGELWISYDICFYKKQLPITSGSQRSIFGLGTGGSGPTTPFFGLAPITVRPGSSPDLGYSVAAGVGTFTFPPLQKSGRYIVTFNYLSSSLTGYDGLTIFPLGGRINCTVSDLYNIYRANATSTLVVMVIINDVGSRLVLGTPLNSGDTVVLPKWTVSSLNDNQLQ